MCSILWWLLYTWEGLGCIFSNLSLDSCIGNKGRKKGREKLHCIHRTYPKSQGWACAFLLHFWLFGGVVCCTKVVWPVLGTGLTGLWPNWHLFRGSLRTCRGSSYMLWLFVLFAWAWFCLRCVEPLPVPNGSETCLLQVILLFAFHWLTISCWSFFYSFHFFFSFLSDYRMCVLSMHSSRERLRTMCGSRTGGWSLPSVMNDWQRCVDWFLAKYCRCMLQLDLCWCRWRTREKGRCQWGL
jgi:hypothetical protein